tara:strand:- start:685 stop:792 length:108 start_codon:yes stop_codon:yes gene_type:complete
MAVPTMKVITSDTARIAVAKPNMVSPKDAFRVATG